ncbi:MAG: phosphate ABC transporter permease subunit PstC [Fibrobacterota bacterium]
MAIVVGPGLLSNRDVLFKGICLLFLGLGITALLLTVGFLFRESGAFSGLSTRLVDCFSGEWRPLATPPLLGLAHAWASTLTVTGIALGISLPLGYGIGIFIAEIAPAIFRNLLTPAMELLAGVPAVVFGFLGAMTIVPLTEVLFELPTGETLLGAGIVLSVMMLPFIASTSAETFRAISKEYREAVLSLGVDRFYMFRRVVMKRAVPGLIAAASLGLARGLGETLAVLLMSGNTTAYPTSVFSRGQPLTALLATEVGETAVHSDKYRMLFTGALALMVIVLALNLGVAFLKKRLHRGLHVQ